MNTYLAIGCAGLVLALALAGALLKKAWVDNGALETQLASAQAVIDQREKDMALNAKAVAQLAEKLVNTETKVVTVERQIYAAPKTTACPDQPAIRAAISGVRDLYLVPAPDAKKH